MLEAELTEMETDEIKLLDFPDEMLLEILSNLSDQSLLSATRVCKRFKVIAEESFAKRYSGASATQFYSMKVSGESFHDEEKQHLPFFRKFGDKIKAINIEWNGSVARNHWLILLIQRYCKSITKVNVKDGSEVDLASIICCMPNLTHLCLNDLKLLNQKWSECTYPKLVHFSARHVGGGRDKFSAFIDHNPQLEHLSLVCFVKQTNDVLYTVNGKLNALKTLKLIGDKASFTRNSTVLKMDSLKTFCVRVNKKSFGPLLASIQNAFKMIEELTICVWDYYELQIGDIDQLCSFKTLKTLEFTDNFELSFELLKTLIDRLPNLVSFKLGDAQNLCETNDDLLDVVSVCQKLLLLNLIIIPMLPILNYDFCTRFANIMETNGSNLKLVLYSEPIKMILTKEEARYIDDNDDDDDDDESDLKHCIIYWSGYDASASTSSSKNLLELNKEVLKKIAAFLDGNVLYAFYQTCKRAQQLVIEFLSEAVFDCAVTPRKCTNENAFMAFGEFICRIRVDLEHYNHDVDDDENERNSYQLTTKFMKSLNKYCVKSLTEMEMNSCVESETVLHWPNLRKLKISNIDGQTLQRFQCPELTHLAIRLFDKNANISIDWGSCFPNLTSLNFGYYNESVEAFLWDLSRIVCRQMRNLSLMRLGHNAFEKNKRRCWSKLTNIIARFGRLATLQVRIKGIEEANVKFLFENCSMLEEFSVFYESINRSWYVEMFRTIKLNCKNLEVVQLVGKSSTFFHSSCLQTIYSMFPNVKINCIDVEILPWMK